MKIEVSRKLQTTPTDFSRQACAEPIKIEPDGTIRQVEVTTQGLNCAPLPGIGTYSAAICCNLITPKPIKLGVGRQQTMPRITEKNGVTLLADLTAGTKAVYQYFDLSSTKKITVSYNGDGAIMVNGVPLSGRSAPISGGANAELCIKIQDGKVDILSFTLE